MTIKQRYFIFSLALLLLLALVACQGEPTVTVVTVEVTTEATRQEVVVITATPLPTSEQVATDLPATEPPATDTPEPTATLSPVRATQQAMMITPVFSDDSQSSIADDDYPAIVRQACDIVRENYVRDNFNGVDWEAICQTYEAEAETITDQETFWGLMADLIHELDDNHSRFVRPDRFAAEFNLPTQGSGQPWAGMSIWPAREWDKLYIWDVCQSGAAANAGLERGDAILEINGEPIIINEDGPDYTTAVEPLYAQEDGATLVIERGADGGTKEVTLNFDGASGCDGWNYGLLSETPRIGYIRVPNFGGDSDTNILTMIQYMEEEAPLEGLVVDIRHNPGGNSDSDIAIFIQGEIGKVGPLRADGTQTIYRIRGPIKWSDTVPMAVLTDGASHSAADYFAAGMQILDRATLVGMPSAGNTEGLTGFNLADSSIIRLAVSTLQLADGSTFEGVGVIPDIMVPIDGNGLNQVPDVQLQAAIDDVLKQINE